MTGLAGQMAWLAGWLMNPLPRPANWLAASRINSLGSANSGGAPLAAEASSSDEL